jgi:hypothetical protein
VFEVDNIVEHIERSMVVNKHIVLVIRLIRIGQFVAIKLRKHILAIIKRLVRRFKLPKQLIIKQLVVRQSWRWFIVVDKLIRFVRF